MEFDKLPEKVQEFVRNLKSAPTTVQLDVNDAIDIGDDLEEASENAIDYMNALISECKEVICFFEDYEG